MPSASVHVRPARHTDHAAVAAMRPEKPSRPSSKRAVLTSAAASHFLEHDVLSVLERGDFDESFALALACKDLGLAVDLARQTGVPAEMTAMVEQIYRRARAQYGDAGGQLLPMKLIEDLTATPLRLTPASPPPPAQE